ncbi:hypothetical protein ACFQY8_03425 [Alloscardovia venturai]|uniref:Phosphoribosylglycinamide synthetase n=1 Tax=Alloscardovia venturai TaxID=1769421 RepID=A0ABW2Y3L2_9BIFI
MTYNSVDSADLLAAEELTPRTMLRVASERLSTVRYVFVVAIEDGIANVAQRSALEYSDAVLIGWPDGDAEDVHDPDNREDVAGFIAEVEKRIDIFRQAESDNDVNVMADTLIHISEYVAQVRKSYQPEFLLPTYAEIRRFVQQQWDEENAAHAASAQVTASDAKESVTDGAEDTLKEKTRVH